MAVNPKILTWARERNGLTIEDLAEVMKRNPDELRMWESGEKLPSYTCLDALAYRHFKIPLAVFFFPEPPSIDDPIGKFRRLPEYELSRLSSDTLQKIRLAQAYQDSLIELMEGSSFERSMHNEIVIDSADISKVAVEVRDYLNISLNKQFGFHQYDQALKAWRHSVEKAGIYIFKDTFKDKFISGFCLLHKQYPIIMINNSNSFSRQIFTLIHELGHIIFGIHGLTDVEETYIEYMDSAEKSYEVACNRFASEVLVPPYSFNKEIDLFKTVGEQSIPEIAKKYSVSREVILRRLLEHKVIDNNYYSKKVEEWNRDYLRMEGESTGGNWYLTRLSYLGENYTRLAFERYHRGRLDRAELASHLNVKARNLDKFESYLGW